MEIVVVAAAALNVAVTEMALLFILNRHVVAPLVQPGDRLLAPPTTFHPTKTDPLVGTAVNVTVSRLSNAKVCEEHEELQFMLLPFADPLAPEGVLVIVPLPDPAFVTV